MTRESRALEINRIIQSIEKKMEAKLISDHIISFKIPDDIFTNMRVATNRFLKAFSGVQNNSGEDADLEKTLSIVSKNKEKLVDITPNGLCVPKHHSSFEYNMYAKTLSDFLFNYIFYNESEVLFFDAPPNMRIKFAEVDEINMKRGGPSEIPHLDSWSNANVDSFTLHIPFGGDVERNRVQLFDVPANFEENWMSPRKFADGVDIANQYSKITSDSIKGWGYLLDASCIHSSNRDSNASARISTDFPITIKRKNEPHLTDEDTAISKMSMSNELGKIPAALMRSLGFKSILIPQNSTGIFESFDRTKHPGAIRAVSV